MFKALLAASLAMLAICAAAAWGGPVPPAGDPFDGSPARPDLIPSPLHLIEAAPQPAAASFLDASVIDGFVAVSVSVSGTGTVTETAPPSETSALPNPSVQPAVIPLPTPLYAALALLVIAAIARRAALRVG